MHILALDTCLGSCSVALYDAGLQTVLAARRELMQRGQAEVLAPMVEAVMAEAGRTMADLTRIAVTKGPGSFTGVRIGLSLAQGLGIGLNIPIVGVDTMRATAAPVLGNEAVTVVHWAGATGLNYVQHFDADGEAQSVMLLLRPDETPVPDSQLVIGTGAASLSNGLRRSALDLPDAAAFVKMASTMGVGALPRPLYLRDADARPQVQTAFSQTIHEEVGGAAADLLSALYATSFYHAWSAADISSMLATPGSIALLARSGEVPVGFILARAIAGEAEILTICTQPKARRQGVGHGLLESLFLHLRKGEVKSVFLEVAADNTTAIALYETTGFMRSGLRKGYYQRRSRTCDALLMRRDLA
jgi:tRNA threonylcarbamoyl adenosine modification protein YeaZ/ribosomal-protein-alanine acetyltransferase